MASTQTVMSSRSSSLAGSGGGGGGGTTAALSALTASACIRLGADNGRPCARASSSARAPATACALSRATSGVSRRSSDRMSLRVCFKISPARPLDRAAAAGCALPYPRRARSPSMHTAHLQPCLYPLAPCTLIVTGFGSSALAAISAHLPRIRGILFSQFAIPKSVGGAVSRVSPPEKPGARGVPACPCPMRRRACRALACVPLCCLPCPCSDVLLSAVCALVLIGLLLP